MNSATHVACGLCGLIVPKMFGQETRAAHHYIDPIVMRVLQARGSINKDAERVQCPGGGDLKYVGNSEQQAALVDALLQVTRV